MPPSVKEIQDAVHIWYMKEQHPKEVLVDTLVMGIFGMMIGASMKAITVGTILGCTAGYGIALYKARR